MRTISLAFVALGLATPAFAGNVRVVGSGPGQIPSLQDAITLSQDGDVILVKTGTYNTIRANGRTMSIVADTGANVMINGAIRAIDIDADDTVVLSGLKASAIVSPGLPDLYAGLLVRHVLGQVVAQDCTFQSATATGVNGNGAITVEDCAGLAVARCGAIGSLANLANSTPGIIVRSGAFVSLDSVDAYGAKGQNAPPAPTGLPDGCDGLPGLDIRAPNSGAASFIRAVGCLFVGGAGGNASIEVGLGTFCGYGGRGGSGAFGINPNGMLEVVSVIAAGGAGGLKDPTCPIGAFDPGGDGFPGLPYWTTGNQFGHCICSTGCFAPAMSLVQLAGVPRKVFGPALVRDDQALRLDFTGQPGEKVEIAVGRRNVMFANQPGNMGVLHIPFATWTKVGTLPASGHLQHGYPLPDLPLSNPGATYFVQARFIDPLTNQVRLSNLHTIVEVDSSY